MSTSSVRISMHEAEYPLTFLSTRVSDRAEPFLSFWQVVPWSRAPPSRVPNENSRAFDGFACFRDDDIETGGGEPASTQSGDAGSDDGIRAGHPRLTVTGPEDDGVIMRSMCSMTVVASGVSVRARASRSAPSSATSMTSA